MTSVPIAAPADSLVDALRRLRERRIETAGSGPPPPPVTTFVSDSTCEVATISAEPPSARSTLDAADHAYVAHAASVTAMGRSLQIQMLGVVASTAASVVADVTAQAATRAADATLDAAGRAASSAKGALVSLHRRVTNADVIEQLRSEAEVLAKFHGSKEWLDFMRAMFAVGLAIAAADGEITESELRDIEDFVGGAGYSKLPKGLVHEVTHWKTRPPSIELAFELASRCGEEAMVVIDNVMEVVTQSDETVHPAEVEFRLKWSALRNKVIA